MRLELILRQALALVLACAAGRVAATPIPEFDYSARLPAPAAKQGLVLASGITWKCEGNVCRTRGPWPTPGVGACQALASKVGAVQYYGHPAAALSAAQLAQCNQGLPGASAAVAPASAPVIRLAPGAMGAIAPLPKMAAKVDPAVLRERARLFRQLQIEKAQAARMAQAALHPQPATGPGGAVVRPGQLVLPPGGAPAPPRGRLVVLSSGDDCNDNRSDVHPGAAEVCDGYDNNCDGVIDEGQTLTFFLDRDGDGHGDAGQRVQLCPNEQSSSVQSGIWLSALGNDCDDSNPDIWHGCP